MERKTNLKPRIGLYTMGLRHYWGQFAGMEFSVNTASTAAVAGATGAYVLNIQLHGSFATEFIYLRDKCHIHQISGFDGSALGRESKTDGVEGVMSAAQPQTGMASVANQTNAVDG